MKRVINGIFFIAIILSGMIKFFGFLKDKGFSGVIAVVVIVVILLFVGFVTFKLSSSKPFYDEVEATNVTFTSLPEKDKERLTKEDIKKILDLKFEYQQKIGMTTEDGGEDSNLDMSLKESLNSPDNSINSMGDTLDKFVIEKSQNKYTQSELGVVWDAEEIYLKQIGVISSE